MRALTSSVLHTDPRGTSPDISMIPAPVKAVTSAATWQSRLAFRPPGLSPVSPAMIRSRRSLPPGLSSREITHLDLAVAGTLPEDAHAHSRLGRAPPSTG